MTRRQKFKRERISEDPEYQRYLASTQWKAKRKRILAERGTKCEVCGWGEKLSLHHLTYVRLYDELDSDLLITCESCHAAFHGRWGVVRAIGANRAEKLAKIRLDNWKQRNRLAMPAQRLAPDKVESNEWNGYDPFADASTPKSWRDSYKSTPSLKDRF